MHIEKYTKIPLDDSGENFLYLRNHCLGYIKRIDNNSFVLNKRTGETFSEISLYEQVIDEKGQQLAEPLIGDNADFFLLSNGKETPLVEFFNNMWGSSGLDKNENS